MKGLRRALCASSSDIWAIDHRRSPLVQRAILDAHRGASDDAPSLSAAFGFDVEEITVEVEARYGEPQIVPGARGGKATAIVYMRGTAMYDFEYQPYVFSTALLAQRVTALANDPSIEMIVLDVDSPGGMITGTPEAADAVHAAAKRKKVVAIVNPLCASAAYWIASQATEIVAVPSAHIGSIGVYQLHWDDSKFWADRGMVPDYIEAPEGGFKTEGSSLVPMSDETREHFQAEVNSIYRQFTSAVARGRGVTRQEVEAEFGRGRSKFAKDAKSAGMIDVVATVEAAMARYRLTAGNGGRNSACLAAEGMVDYGGAVEAESADVETSVSPVDWIFEAQGEMVATILVRDGDALEVAGDWPAGASFDSQLIEALDSEEVKGCSIERGDETVLRIEVANGHARYQLDGEADDGVLLGHLLDGEYRAAESDTDDCPEVDDPPEPPAGRAAEAATLEKKMRLLELS